MYLSSEELEELKKGDGAWENIQDVLRGAFQRLFLITEAAIGRIENLEQVIEAKTRESERQTLHIEALAHTLNTVSEELRREKEEDQRKKDDIDNNVVTLSGRLDIVDQLLGGMSKAASSGEALSVEVARVDRRVQLLEDELGHVIEAIDHKIDEDALERAFISQKRGFQEALKKRCKTVVVEQEMLNMRQQLDLRIDEWSHSIAASITQLQHDVVTVEGRALEKVSTEIDARLHAAQVGLDHIQASVSNWETQLDSKIRKHREKGVTALKEVREMTSVVVPAILNDIVELQKQVETMNTEERQPRRGCQSSEIESLQTDVSKLQSEHCEMKRMLDDAVKIISEVVGIDQIQALEIRMTDRLHVSVVDIQRLLAETSAKVDNHSSELTTLEESHREQTETLVTQLDEIDQVTRLIGHQLVRVASQTQVLWEERQSQVEAVIEAQQKLEDEECLPMGPRSNVEQTSDSATNLMVENVERRQVEHDALQAQVQEKLQHYQSLFQLDSPA